MRQRQKIQKMLRQIIMENEYLPRNEYELCEFFQIILFGRIEEFSPKPPTKNAKQFSLSDEEIERLYKTGIVNRIFRKWFQTNWLYEGDSSHFSGSTPRQELSRLYPNLVNGGDYMSVELEKNNNGWKVAPRYYSKELLRQNNGVFEFGRDQLKNKEAGLTGPQFDCEFEAFVEAFKLFSSKTDSLSLKDFIEFASGNIILNSGINLGENKFMRLKDNFCECLNWIIKHHPQGEDNFLDTDKAFFNLWEILRVSNKKLLPFGNLIKNIELDEERMENDFEYQKSEEILFNFGTAFDRYFLFPLDRYFGMAEIVWTEKETFISDMGITIELLKNNFKFKQPPTSGKFPNLDNFFQDMRYFWFSPPSSFRLLNSFFESYNK